LATAYEEHLAILAALEQGEKGAALDRLRQHIQASARMVQQALANMNPPPEEPSKPANSVSAQV
jgi:DNA-binding GntR family transcriptional regulator